MKADCRNLFLGLACLGFMLGCAPARLSVHVDLYRGTGTNREPVNNFQQVRAVQIAVNSLQNDITTLFAHYRVARTNLLNAEIASAMELPDKEAQQTAVTARKEVFEQLMKNANDLEAEFQKEFDTLNSEIERWRGLVQRLQSNEPLAQMDAEKQRQAVIAAIETIQKKVKTELSPQPPGDKTPRRLSLARLHDHIKKLNLSDSKNIDVVSPGAMAEKTHAAAVRDQLIVDPGAQNLLEKADPPDYLNPDLLADDSDPFYQVLANPNLKPGWSTNFFIQQAAADGKVSFLIVRETAVRFTVNEAKANPAVLIKTQLRSARAGIKTVAAVAKAINPALAAIPGASAGTPPAADGATNAAAPTTVAALRQQEEQSRALLVKLQQTLADFEKQLTSQRDAIKPAEQQLASAEAAAKAAQAAADKKKRERDDAQAAFNADNQNQAKKQTLDNKNAELVEADKAKKESDDKLTAANAEVAAKKTAADAWAKQSFAEKVKPVLEAYRANLAALASIGASAPSTN